ncbi:NADPH:quinone oxidoreductase family protein [Psychromarinibacter sp. S121]|uniref:NADPH:quinone oxidoreductase family protein n=1 Tax=Psychromarinibacter sp. S121 TaxID=3415127 RepID=UPI003C7C3D61
MTAKAMLSREPGGPETLELAEVPMPEPGPGEVRVAVKAAGVNFPDTLMIRDLYQYRPDRPFAPGGEIAGVIDAVGPGVAMAIGTRVLALTLYGGFASHVVIPADDAIPFPDAMPFDEAAAFIFTYGTSYYGLTDRGHLSSGKSLLVLGAAGGIGASAVEIGLALGARVIGAVSSEEKAEFVRGLGARDVLVYPKEMDRAGQKAFGAGIKALCPEGVDVVYDPVGGAYAEPALRAMAWGGRYLVVGFPAGIPEIPLNLPLLKGCDIAGVFWGAFTKRDPARFAHQVAEMFRMYEAGQIRPRVSETYPLAEAATALTRIADRQATGKIVLTI